MSDHDTANQQVKFIREKLSKPLDVLIALINKEQRNNLAKDSKLNESHQAYFQELDKLRELSAQLQATQAHEYNKQRAIRAKILQQLQLLNGIKYVEDMSTGEQSLVENKKRLNILTGLAKKMAADRCQQFAALLPIEILYLIEYWLYPLEREVKALRKELNLRARSSELIAILEEELLAARFALAKAIATKDSWSLEVLRQDVSRIGVAVLPTSMLPTNSPSKSQVITLEQYAKFKKFLNEPNTQRAFWQSALQTSEYDDVKHVVPDRYFKQPKHNLLLNTSQLHVYHGRNLWLPDIQIAITGRDSNLYLDDAERQGVWFYKLRRHLKVREQIHTQLAKLLTDCHNLLNGCPILKKRYTLQVPLGEFELDHFFSDIARAEAKLQQMKKLYQTYHNAWFIGQKNRQILAFYQGKIADLAQAITDLKQQKAREITGRLEPTLGQLHPNTQQPLLSKSSFDAYIRFIKATDGQLAAKLKPKVEFNQLLVQMVKNHLDVNSQSSNTGVGHSQATVDQGAELIADIRTLLSDELPALQVIAVKPATKPTIALPAKTVPIQSKKIFSKNGISRQELLDEMRRLCRLIAKYQPQLSYAANQLLLVCSLSDDMDDYSQKQKASKLLQELAQLMQEGAASKGNMQQQAELLLERLAQKLVFPALLAERSIPAYEFFKTFKGTTDDRVLDDLFASTYGYLDEVIKQLISLKPFKAETLAVDVLALLENSTFEKFKKELATLEHDVSLKRLAFTVQFLLLTAVFHRKGDETIAKLMHELSQFVQVCDFSTYQELLPVLSYFLAPKVRHIAGSKLLEAVIFKSLKHIISLSPAQAIAMLNYVNTATTDHCCYLNGVFFNQGCTLARLNLDNFSYLLELLNDTEVLQDTAKIQFIWQIIGRCQDKQQQAELLSAFKTKLLAYLLSHTSADSKRNKPYDDILTAIDQKFQVLAISANKQFTAEQRKQLIQVITEQSCHLANLALIDDFIADKDILQHTRTTVLAYLFSQENKPDMVSYKKYLHHMSKIVPPNHYSAEQIGKLKQIIEVHDIETNIELLDLVQEHIWPAQIRSLTFSKSLKYVFRHPAARTNAISAWINNLISLATPCEAECKAVLADLKNLKDYIALPTEARNNLWYKDIETSEIKVNDELFNIILSYFPMNWQEQAVKNALAVYFAQPELIAQQNYQYQLIKYKSDIRLNEAEKISLLQHIKANFHPNYFVELYKLTCLVAKATTSSIDYNMEKVKPTESGITHERITYEIDLPQTIVNAMVQFLRYREDLQLVLLNDVRWKENFNAILAEFTTIYTTRSGDAYQRLAAQFDDYLAHTDVSNHLFNQLIQAIGMPVQQKKLADLQEEATRIDEDTSGKQAKDASSIAEAVKTFLKEVIEPRVQFNTKNANRKIELIGKNKYTPVISATKKAFFELLASSETESVEQLLHMASNLVTFAEQLASTKSGHQEGEQLKQLLFKSMTYNSGSLLQRLMDSAIENKADYFNMLMQTFILPKLHTFNKTDTHKWALQHCSQALANNLIQALGDGYCKTQDQLSIRLSEVENFLATCLNDEQQLQNAKQYFYQTLAGPALLSASWNDHLLGPNRAATLTHKAYPYVSDVANCYVQGVMATVVWQEKKSAELQQIQKNKASHEAKRAHLTEKIKLAKALIDYANQAQLNPQVVISSVLEIKTAKLGTYSLSKLLGLIETNKQQITGEINQHFELAKQYEGKIKQYKENYKQAKNANVEELDTLMDSAKLHNTKYQKAKVELALLEALDKLSRDAVQKHGKGYLFSKVMHSFWQVDMSIENWLSDLQSHDERLAGMIASEEKKYDIALMRLLGQWLARALTAAEQLQVSSMVKKQLMGQTKYIKDHIGATTVLASNPMSKSNFLQALDLDAQQAANYYRHKVNTNEQTKLYFCSYADKKPLEQVINGYLQNLKLNSQYYEISEILAALNIIRRDATILKSILEKNSQFIASTMVNLFSMSLVATANLSEEIQVGLNKQQKAVGALQNCISKCSINTRATIASGFLAYAKQIVANRIELSLENIELLEYCQQQVYELTFDLTYYAPSVIKICEKYGELKILLASLLQRVDNRMSHPVTDKISVLLQHVTARQQTYGNMVAERLLTIINQDTLAELFKQKHDLDQVQQAKVSDLSEILFNAKYRHLLQLLCNRFAKQLGLTANKEQQDLQRFLSQLSQAALQANEKDFAFDKTVAAMQRIPVKSMVSDVQRKGFSPMQMNSNASSRQLVDSSKQESKSIDTHQSVVQSRLSVWKDKNLIAIKPNVAVSSTSSLSTSPSTTPKQSFIDKVWDKFSTNRKLKKKEQPSEDESSSLLSRKSSNASFYRSYDNEDSDDSFRSPTKKTIYNTDDSESSPNTLVNSDDNSDEMTLSYVSSGNYRVN
jgi:hypothetical protein